MATPSRAPRRAVSRVPRVGVPVGVNPHREPDWPASLLALLLSDQAFLLWAVPRTQTAPEIQPQFAGVNRVFLRAPLDFPLFQSGVRSQESPAVPVQSRHFCGRVAERRMLLAGFGLSGEGFAMRCSGIAQTTSRTVGAYWPHDSLIFSKPSLPVCTCSLSCSQPSPLAAVSENATPALTTLPAPGISFRKLRARACPVIWTSSWSRSAALIGGTGIAKRFGRR